MNFSDFTDGGTPAEADYIVGYKTGGGAGSDRRWLLSATRPIKSVLSYGAVGDGVTNDTAAFQAAANSGNMIYVPPPSSAYMIGTITGHISGTVFFGDGPSYSIIRARVGTTTDMFLIAGYSNIAFRNLTIDANNISNLIPLHFQNDTNVDIDGVNIINWDKIGISLGICDLWKIRNCRIIRTTAVNTQNQAITIYSSGQATTRGLIDSNMCENSGIDVSSSDTIIRNNIIKNWKYGGGITTEQETSCFNLQIIGNNISGSTGTDAGGTTPMGIENWAPNSVIEGNICYNCGGSGIDHGGKNGTVAGNICYNNGQTTPLAGINARYGTSTYNASGSAFTGNRCYDSGGATQSYGYLEESASLADIVVSGNNFKGNTTGPYLLASASTVIDGCNAPNTQTGSTYAVVGSDRSIIANKAGTVTLTLLAAAAYIGRQLTVKTIQAQTVVSDASNVVPLIGGSAGTAILAGTAGKWALLESDGTNWVIIAGN